jgi:hypothetical protein
MLRLDLFKVDTDISQNHIRKKFYKYLLLKQRHQNLCNKIQSGGFCMGFTVLAMYSLYIELTQIHHVNSHGKLLPRDDWRWLRSALTRLSKWDESENSLNKKTHAAKKLRSDTERMISLIEYFQESSEYDFTSQFQIENHLVDTNKRKFIQEYTLAGIFTPTAFSQEILFPSDDAKANYARITTPFQELIKENRLVFISSLDHVSGVLKNKNNYFYFNSNEKNGWKIYTEEQMEKLSRDLFSAYLENVEQLPLQIKILSDSKDKREKYPDQTYFLTALNSENLKNTDYDKTAILYLAAELGCRKSLKYHLYNTSLPLEVYINAPINPFTPLGIATFEGYTDLVLDLLKAGADPNIKQGSSTPLYLAIRKMNVEAIQCLLEVPNIVVSKKEYEALIAVSSLTPKNQALKYSVLMAQPIYMEMVIQEQINKFNRKSHRARSNMLQKLAEVRRESREAKLEPKEQLVLMLDRMLPILVAAHRDTQYSMWRSPVLIDRILKLAEQFNLQFNQSNRLVA